jgi:hypothetical protein
VDFDMDSSGNGCPNDGSDCTIGPIEECVSVANVPGTTFSVDVVITGLTNGFAAFNYNVYFPDTTLNLTRQTHADPLLNLPTQSTGSNVADLSESVQPEGQQFTGSPHHVGILESGTSEATPPFTQGVLGRYEFTVAEGAVSALYDVTLERPPLSAYLDQGGESYRLDPVTTGLIALGQPCP